MESWVLFVNRVKSQLCLPAHCVVTQTRIQTRAMVATGCKSPLEEAGLRA